MLYFIKVVHILYILHYFACFASKLIKKRRALSFAVAPSLYKAIASTQVHRIGTLSGKTSQVVTHNPPLSGKTSQTPFCLENHGFYVVPHRPAKHFLTLV